MSQAIATQEAGQGTAASKVVALPKAPAKPSPRHREEIEFLPAALEIMERPPSPTVRIFSGTIMLFTVLALAWSWFGQVDVVAVAQGRIVPSGRTKTIQPMEIGVVRAIHVQDGQTVRAGDPLIELDPTTVTADRNRLETELLSARTEVARLRAALTPDSGAPGSDPSSAFAPPAEAPTALVRMHAQLLLSQLAEQRAKLAAFDRELARKEADRAAVNQAITKLTITMPLIRERADALRTLSAQGTTSRFQYLALQQDLVEHEQELLVQKTRLTESEAAIASVGEQRRQAEAEFARTLYTQLAEAERRVSDTAQDLAKAEQRVGLQRLTAPVNGTVQQLAIHTVGGVVTPAQPLMVIVPEDSQLEVQASILNKDIGFVQVGQPAAIKVDTFSFTKYGLIPGHVASVSGDVVQQKEEDPAKQQGPVYAARVALEKTSLDVDGRSTALSPGMAVTVEIKTSQRRIIDYLLSPISRRSQEAFHER
ncbi:HlyD family type I secretion periplasmic adaptor subunit [Azospirillum agricola]|uniref:HlyD family type I secretion periplasmic adaptor subunit n=1 Tax=Azospirillum agricola TaxID=1720247 RepID=UPI000A0F121A|nr:HlyD family type I secretion periplasmic adaptor subunit [Azospirillum agricola]SMH41382.1 hemolysin D [Azospirillum lipoferum]